jgi:hypothetical protein
MQEKSKANKSIGIGVGIVVAMFVGTIGRDAAKSLFKRESDPRSQAFLSKVASEINKGTPMVVDQETELMNVLGLEATIVYNYRLVNTSAAEIDGPQLVQQLQPSATNAACTTPETRDNFLKKGITMRYSYADASRVHIASFDVTPKSCGF